MASLICEIVCLLGPRIRSVTDLGSTQSSTKVNLFSPRTASYTKPALPKTSGVRSSTELQADPPQAKARRSILRLLARRRATIFSLARASNEIGSTPF